MAWIHDFINWIYMLQHVSTFPLNSIFKVWVMDDLLKNHTIRLLWQLPWPRFRKYAKNKDGATFYPSNNIWPMIAIWVYGKTCVKRPFSKRPKIGLQDQLSLNAGQKYCRMLQGEHSAILLTFIKLPFVITIFVSSLFEWLCYTGFTVCVRSTVAESVVLYWT